MGAESTTERHATDEVRDAARLIRDLARFGEARGEARGEATTPLLRFLHELARRLSATAQR